MNRQPLAGLDEEWVERMDRYIRQFDAEDHPKASIALFNAEVHANRHLIIECMRVALRWRNDLDQMKEERG